MDLSSVDLPTETLRTERLVLRPFRSDDVDPVFRACQDPETQRWLLSLPSPYTREAAVEFVTGLAPRCRAEGTALTCAVETDGVFVGSCGAHAFDQGRLGPEIGYWIAPDARGRGYAAEAARAVADWGTPARRPPGAPVRRHRQRRVPHGGPAGGVQPGGRRALLPGVPRRSSGGCGALLTPAR